MSERVLGYLNEKKVKKGFFEKVYEVTKKIPRGRAVSYGQIAVLCGYPRAALMVGWALHSLSAQKLLSVPWHRVVNREGRISTTCLDHSALSQVSLLKKEGIEVKYKNGNYFVDLKKSGWNAGIV